MSGAVKLKWPVKGLDLTAEYGLTEPSAVEEKRGILKLRCTTGDYALKCNDMSHKARLNLTELQKFLQTGQFSNYVANIPNRSGDYFTLLGGKTYSLMNWVPGRECHFSDLQDLFLYAQTLGKLHKATLGFSPNCGPWPERWQGRLLTLKALNLKNIPNSGKLNSLLPKIIKLGEIALALTEDSDVQASLKQPSVLCHHDLTFRNLLITPEDQCYMIDFDMATADAPARDLAQFMLNALKQQAWQPNVALEIIRAYALEYPMSRGDLGLALAFMHFPRSLWSLAERIECGQSCEELAEKAEKVLARQPFLSIMCELFDFKV